MASQVETILRKFPEQLEAIEAAYRQALRSQEIADDLLYDICHLIEDFQRALDWTATDLDRRFGVGRDRSPYFPLQGDSAKFQTIMARDFPSVPKPVFEAMERHQPYQPGKELLGHLHDLARVNKHQDFTPQVRTETRRVEVTGPGGGQVEWTPGAVTFGPGVFINGVPIDPRTQMPVPSQHQTVRQVAYVGWRFAKSNLDVLPTLKGLAVSIADAVREIRSVAGLG